ncbi:dimethylsulfoniopropionate lyase [Pseudomonas sp. LS1212]|uniref:dimethylsulfoniopropionate lyase n=1 Tax=Pseudomonas sp. LS1212 TaxID=2972478 RepID=UPI00215BF31A|nr:dimethylsulfoniopropionate lyase [Pseudomonas sp. LS1212]UVJ46396.1 dimethylsulfoniopropionate lyase [Pseudomonas sp. LS1212]
MKSGADVLSADHELIKSGRLLQRSLQKILSSNIGGATVALDTAEACATALSSAQWSIAKASEAPHEFPASLESYLSHALNSAPRTNEYLGAVLDALGIILPRASWMKREAKLGQDDSFVERHRHAMITGAGGIFECPTLTLGLALMAPFNCYPFHNHPPAEFYLVLSPGEWYREGSDWWSPGAGGLVFNPPSCIHAMKSTDVPLLALWGLFH